MPNRFFWSVAPLGIVVRVALLVAIATLATHVHDETTGVELTVTPSVGAMVALLVRHQRSVGGQSAIVPRLLRSPGQTRHGA